MNREPLDLVDYPLVDFGVCMNQNISDGEGEWIEEECGVWSGPKILRQLDFQHQHL